jgi:hypothetical protein
LTKVKLEIRLRTFEHRRGYSDWLPLRLAG